MRWFKHLTMAHEDFGLSAIAEEMGAEAYGVYWLLLEAVAGPMDKESTRPILTHSDVKWASICHVSVRKFRSIAIRLRELRLIETRSMQNRLLIEVPNLLKYRDEYSKKSGPAPDSRTDTDNRAEGKREQRESMAETAELDAGAEWALSVYSKHPKQTCQKQALIALGKLYLLPTERALFDVNYPGWIEYWSHGDARFVPALAARDGDGGFVADGAWRRSAPKATNGRRLSPLDRVTEQIEREEREAEQNRSKQANKTA